MRWYSGSLAIVIIALLFACSQDESAEDVNCGGTAVAFTEVNAIIQSSCTTNSGCHGSGSRNGPGALLTYTEIYNARSSIKSAVASGSMPKGSSLSSDKKNAIICWIENGAQNN